MAMGWDDLRFVLALGRAGTMTSAAQALGVSHSTVARRLRALEADVGRRIFEPTSEGYAATEAGEALLEAAAEIETQVLAATRALSASDDGLSGTLRVTTLDFVLELFPQLLSGFARAHPEVDLVVTTGMELVNLTRHDADLALRLTNAPPEHLVGRRLGRMEYALYRAESLEGDDPTQLPWLAWGPDARAPGIDAWMARHTPGVREALVTNSGPALQSALLAGMGITFMPCIWGDRQPGIQRMRPVEPDFGIDLWVLTHPDLRRAPRVRAFMRHAAACVAAQSAALAGDV
ncbi:MAG: LysR family transcriptional regulator [Sandaracinaceae bacterium]